MKYLLLVLLALSLTSCQGSLKVAYGLELENAWDFPAGDL